MKDRNNKFMSDSYLKKKAAEQHPWMASVYDETSGFVHFSNKHIMDATVPSKTEEMTFTTAIGKTDNDVSNASKLEGVLCMIEISNCISNFIYGWIETKRIKG